MCIIIKSKSLKDTARCALYIPKLPAVVSAYPPAQTQSASLLVFGPAHLAQGFAPRPQRNPAMARPKLKEHRRGQLIKLLSEEKQIIQRNAYIAGLTVSEYMRRCSLNKRLHSRIDDKAINRLSSLCGLMKHLLMQIVDHPHENELRRELNAILTRITATLRAVVRNDEDSE